MKVSELISVLRKAKAHVMIPVIEDRIEFCGQWAGEYGKKAYMVIPSESEE